LRTEIDFYRIEWKLAEKRGDIEYSNTCKEMFRMLLMESLKRPYRQYEEKLKQFPMLSLN